MITYDREDLWPHRKASSSEFRPRKKKQKKAAVGETLTERPEGEMGLLWDAMQFVYHLRKSFVELEESFARIKFLTKKACDHNINDSDRALINRQYQSALKSYDQSIQEIKVMGVPFFTGEYDENPKVFSLSEKSDQEEQMEMKIASASWSSEKLGLKKTRLDNFVNARKTESAVEKALQSFQGFRDYISAKESYLDVYRNKLEMPPPDFEAQSSGKLINSNEHDEIVSDESDEFEELINYDVRYHRIRERQEALARRTNRTAGILLNLFS
ncbi:MAG: hypothetical protein EA369_02970 [Bradymonadales bacterium]|nr:MAG: hypothetical protein EA369_02970 [Bradymonadales bacterium]